MLQGIIDYLTGPSLDAKILRDNFVFKVVPMLNPDGVAVGNYRCSMAGLDLNRMWKEPSKRLTPAIWHMKQMMRTLQEDREIVLFVDLHGHSRKHNIFCYGCEPKTASMDARLATYLFPRLLWRNSQAQAFSFSDCTFKVQRSKESTARVVGYKQLGIKNSLTMEASFAGANFGRLAGMHFTPTVLREMGHGLCDSILDYFDPDQVPPPTPCPHPRRAPTHAVPAPAPAPTPAPAPAPTPTPTPTPTSVDADADASELHPRPHRREGGREGWVPYGPPACACSPLTPLTPHPLLFAWHAGAAE